MLRNPFKVLQDLVARPGAEIGVVTSVSTGEAVVTLPGGGVLRVRGTASVSDTVYIRDGVIESIAPGLPIVLIDV